MAALAEQAALRRRQVSQDIRRALGVPDGVCDPMLDFSAVDEDELARTLVACPRLLKPLIANAYCGTRALERDLGWRLSSPYEPQITPARAGAAAAFVLEVLRPAPRSLSAFVEADLKDWWDTKLRAQAAEVEVDMLGALNARVAVGAFRRRRRLQVDRRKVTVSCTYPERGLVQAAVEVKAISAGDMDKRLSEIETLAGALDGQRGQSVSDAFALIVCLRVASADQELVAAQRLGGRAAITAVVFCGPQAASLDQAACEILAAAGLPSLGAPRVARQRTALPRADALALF